MAVVGAGISGMAAAYELRSAGIETLLLEARARPGGKIDSTPVDGLTVDSGPDGFVARDRAAADLCRRLGLGADLVEPAAEGARVWLDGALRPLPRRSLLGAPWTAEGLQESGLVSAAGAEALARGLAGDAEALRADATVGEVLRPRVGDEVFERIIDPLLGGINAGAADEMSLEACAAPLYEAACQGGPFGQALQQVADRQRRQRDPDTGSAVFQSIDGGMTRLVDALVGELGESLHLTTAARSLAPDGETWRVVTSRGAFEAAGVILACPAWQSARLLEGLAPDAAAALADIDYSSVALATFVLASEVLRRPLDGSGFVVPRSQGLMMTACSWTSAKWRHYNQRDTAVLRVSAGRSDDRRWQDLDHDELLAILAGELAETGMISAADASAGRFEARVTAWHDSLPQYRRGHLSRVAEIEDRLAAETPGVAVTGAAMRGVGLPACIRNAHAAATATARAVLGDGAAREGDRP
ncbi:MAG: protoporphyrinogen oxidase [Acidimicrobiaceae bacterium]|nr:protoporphyrinogen oxidase [Acidimicrobiaceae bacterium]MCY4294197.1 protoporphyrinogen oxidase [Acidimicrobiaceae bacterium]